MDKITNLVELFEHGTGRFAENKLFGIKNPDGKSLKWITYAEIGRRVDNLRSGLLAEGLKKGDALGFIGNNRPEWVVSAFAAYGAGARFIPMYESELLSIWEYIIRDSSVRFLIVSKQEIYEKIRSLKGKIPSLEKIYIIDDGGDMGMDRLEQKGSASFAPSIKPGPDDIAALVYTSGTTGDPKGVLLSHKNFVSNARAGFNAYSGHLTENSRSISILPWAHSYGQTAELYNWFQFGGSIGFMQDVSTLADDLLIVRPTFIIAVPRIYNKIYNALHARMEQEGGIKKKLFDIAVSTAVRRRKLAADGATSFFLDLKYRLFDRLVFKKIRDRFGGRVVGSLTASALMNIEIAEFFSDIGIPVFDCYGLSETSPAVTMNSYASNRPGSVGRPLEDIRVVIDSSVVEEGSRDGEIIVYGPNVMKGYHNKPEATAAVMKADGGFRTGDRGRLDEDGFLYITGRIKEQYKLQNGKYVFPGLIEEDIKLLPEVASAMIYGDGREYNVALLVPDFDYLKHYAEANSMPSDPESILDNENIKEMISSKVSVFLKKKYGGYEVPRKFIFLKDDFTLENGMATQTMKLKRRAVLDNYIEKIEKLYK